MKTNKTLRTMTESLLKLYDYPTTLPVSYVTDDFALSSGNFTILVVGNEFRLSASGDCFANWLMRNKEEVEALGFDMIIGLPEPVNHSKDLPKVIYL